MQLAAHRSASVLDHPVSQSPYGAMWFATYPGACPRGHPSFSVAIPLRGYVVCNRDDAYYYDGEPYCESQSPYGAKWFATFSRRAIANMHSSEVAIPLRGYVVCNWAEWLRNNPGWEVSQSPYGAKWFATPQSPRVGAAGGGSQSPYGAKWFATMYYRQVCESLGLKSQSPYGAKWFATLREGGLGERGLLGVAIPLRG